MTSLEGDEEEEGEGEEEGKFPKFIRGSNIADLDSWHFSDVPIKAPIECHIGGHIQ